MNPSVQLASAVSQRAVLDWMDEVRESAQRAPCAKLIDFDGVDAIDVLLVPIYLALLNATRDRPTVPGSAAARAIRRARLWAYRWKVAWREQRAVRKSAAPGPADILFWSRAINHTTTMDAVAAAAADLGDHYRFLACQPNIFDGLRRFVPNPVYTKGAWPSTVRRARREGASRARELSRAGLGTLPPQPPGSLGDWESVLRAALIGFLPLVSESVANAHAALNACRPKVLVVGYDLTAEGRAGCRVAAARSVPTAVLMHGNICGDPLQAYHCADRVLVYAEPQRQLLVQAGIAADRVVVCGAPQMDHRPRQSGEPHPLLQKQLGLRAGEPWILVLTSGPGHRVSHAHHQIVIEQLERLSQVMPNVPMVVKLHPKDLPEHYRPALKRSAAARLFVVPDGARGFPAEIFEWLQGCSLVLTGASTAATEAMLMDVPVITMDFCNEIHDVDFIDAGATRHVRTGDALVEQAREILRDGGPDDPWRTRVQNYLRDAFDTLDGRAGVRCAQALHAMIGRDNSP